ncbi:MAG: hypothetical protein ACKVVT_17425 [Dehalococcoidia bacterium]
MKWKQTELHAWPSGDWWAVAALGISPQVLADSLPVRFEPGLDDLGTYQAAALDVERLGQVVFVARPDAPHLGIDVLVDMAIPRTPVVRWLEAATGLSPDAFLWIEDRLRDPRPVIELQRDPAVGAILASVSGKLPDDVTADLGLVLA